MSTYLQYYREEICPKIQALDILLKTETEPYSINEVAKFLDLPKNKLCEILEENKIKIITKGVFFYLLHKFEPRFSTMLIRELEHENKNLYSIDEISHIYLIEKKYIEEVAKIFGKEEFSYEELSLLFAEIGKK